MELKFSDYAKRPVVIKAVEVTDALIVDVASEPNGTIKLNGYNIVACDEETLIIETLEGNHTCKVGSYIIVGVKGEIYPVRRDIFDETYVPVKKQ
ncbi:hypothetical protein HNP86_002021 [Methanococcus maripaludis]|uniref:Uncharacterized protein n=1 Tax=Methanococcus maripaludis TaxID=39152 RepID=A0A7J9NVZ5_METMI|nr:hypothetical protein [Methanococcus maripaludis]MBA2851862.1 hypothetical protein [Methanococcus maripaludis]